MNDREELKWIVDGMFSGGRPRICLACGEPFGAFDLHEGIVTRQDVRGWKKPLRSLIMVELNCVPLHHSCHIDRPPPREAVWQFQKMFYGVDALLEWYEGLPWKSGRPPRNFE